MFIRLHVPKKQNQHPPNPTQSWGVGSTDSWWARWVVWEVWANSTVWVWWVMSLCLGFCRNPAGRLLTELQSYFWIPRQEFKLSSENSILKQGIILKTHTQYGGETVARPDCSMMGKAFWASGYTQCAQKQTTSWKLLRAPSRLSSCVASANKPQTNPRTADFELF